MQFRSSSFLFNKETKTLTAEMAELSLGGKREVFHAVYPDACDEGLSIVSDATGKVVTYVSSDLLTNSEDEIVGWILLPTQDSERKVPACKGTRVVIYND